MHISKNNNNFVVTYYLPRLRSCLGWLIRGKWTLGLSKFSNKYDHFFRPKNRDFISKFHICPSHLQLRITQALSSTGPLSLSQIYSRQRFEQEQNQPCSPSSSTPDRRGIIPINASNSLIAKTIASICTCNLRLGLHISQRRVVSSSNLSNHAHVMDPYFLTVIPWFFQVFFARN